MKLTPPTARRTRNRPWPERDRAAGHGHGPRAGRTGGCGSRAWDVRRTARRSRGASAPRTINGLASPFFSSHSGSAAWADPGGPAGAGRITESAVRDLSRVYNKAWEQIMAGRLQGKTALVTGATSNIGRAIAEAFAAEGAHVVISGRSAQRGAQVVDGIRSRGGRADFVMAELDGSAEASRSLARQATSILGGRIDILVNNAGIYPRDSTVATDDQPFTPLSAVHLNAPSF